MSVEHREGARLHTERLSAPYAPTRTPMAIYYGRLRKNLFNALLHKDPDKAYIRAVRFFHLANQMLEGAKKARPASRLLRLKYAHQRAERRRLGIGDATGRAIRGKIQ